MKTNKLYNFSVLLILVAGIAASLSSCTNASNNKAASNSNDSITNSSNPPVETLLTRFDSLDFDVYTHQKWDSLQLSHADDIIVHYPDGSITKGLHDHIEALKPMFVFAPDTRITEHPVKFGSGDWTSVIGTLEGTFTQPMPIGNGKTIPPTGKAFKLSMSTVGHWKNGRMSEEYLFWDNQAFMKQIGLAQ